MDMISRLQSNEVGHVRWYKGVWKTSQHVINTWIVSTFNNCYIFAQQRNYRILRLGSVSRLRNAYITIPQSNHIHPRKVWTDGSPKNHLQLKSGNSSEPNPQLLGASKCKFFPGQKVTIPSTRKTRPFSVWSQPLHLSKRECHILRSITRVVQPSLEKNLRKSNWIMSPENSDQKIKKICWKPFT